jgi:hypothetical protein
MVSITVFSFFDYALSYISVALAQPLLRMLQDLSYPIGGGWGNLAVELRTLVVESHLLRFWTSAVRHFAA